MKIKINGQEVEVQENDQIEVNAFNDRGDLVKAVDIIRHAKVVTHLEIG